MMDRNPKLLLWVLGLALAMLAVGVPTMPTPAVAAEVTYYFSAGGDDANDGLSAATPRRSLELIEPLLRPGVTVLLERGSAWYAPGLSWNLEGRGVAGGPAMRIGAYGDPTRPRPIVADLARVERAAWRDDGNGAFSIARGPRATNERLVRVLVDGTALARVHAPADLVEGSYCVTSSRIHVRSEAFAKAGSAELVQHAPGALIRARGTHGLVVQDLDLRGVEGWSAARLEGRNGEIAFENVNLKSYRLPPLVSLPSTPLPPGTYYFSSSTGNDATGDGSIGNPWKSVSTFRYIMAPGVTLLLKRGDTWYDPTLSWVFNDKAGTPASPMRIGAYDTGARPIVCDMVKHTSVVDDAVSDAWHREGNNVYSIALYDVSGSLDHVWRLYLGGVPIPKVDSLTANASMPDSSYKVAGRRIHVKCAAFEPNPDVTSIQSPYTSGGYFIAGKNTSYLTIEDLELRGGDATAGVIVFNAPSSHVTLQRLDLNHFWKAGVGFGNFDSPADSLHRDVSVLNCRLEKSWTPAMNSEFVHTVRGGGGTTQNGALGGMPGGDGIAFVNAVDGALVRDCFIKDLGHSGFGNELKLGTHEIPIVTRNITFERDTVVRGTSSYLRGFSVAGAATACNNVVIRRCYFYDLTNASHLGGAQNYVYSNVFDLTNVTTSGSANTQPYCFDTMVGTNYPGTFVFQQCVVANNTLVAADAMFYYAYSSVDSNLVRANRIANNACADWRTTAYSKNGHAVAMEQNWQGVRYDNNGFWRGSSGSSIYWDRGTSLGLAGMNALVNCDNNLEQNPLFAGGSGLNASKFKLGAGSPYIASGTPLSALLPAGMPAVDFYGKPYASTPSAGAIQSITVSIAGAPTQPIDVGTLVTLTPTVTPAGMPISAYAWEARINGSLVASGTNSTFLHSPTSPATYEYRLTVTDSGGLTWAAPSVFVTVAQLARIELYDGATGTPLASGALTRNDVIAMVYNAVNPTATRNGSAHTFPADGRFTLDGAYVITAVGVNTAVANFTIDKTAPVVSGVTNGATYTANDTIWFNEGTATLNGQPFTSGGIVSVNGTYTLVVTDPAGNTTTVGFTMAKPPTITLVSGYGVTMASGAITDTTVTVALADFTSATVSVNGGAPAPLVNNATRTEDGVYTITAYGVSTVVKSFTIRRIPTLIAPADGATNVARKPAFTWTAPPSATSYRLQVSTSSNFSPLAINKGGITGTSYTPTTAQRLNPNTRYYWRVNATGPRGTTAWSSVRSFWTGN